MVATGKTRRKIALFGDSLTLTSVGASLRRHAALEIVFIDAGNPAAVTELRSLSPAVVIFDLGTVPPDFAFSLLKEQPDLLLIGVDAAGDKLLMLSGQQAHAVTTTDLVQLIENWPGSTHRLPSWQAVVGRLGQFVTSRVSSLRVLSRQKKFAFALAGIAACVVLGVGLSLAGKSRAALLMGTAVGTNNGWPVLAFVAGILLGGIGIALWFHWHRQKNGNGR